MKVANNEGDRSLRSLAWSSLIKACRYGMVKKEFLEIMLEREEDLEVQAARKRQLVKVMRHDDERATEASTKSAI